MIRLFRVFMPTSLVALLILDTLLIFGCFTATIWAATGDEFEIFMLYDGGLSRAVMVTLNYLIALYFLDLFQKIRIKSRIQFLQQICLAIGIVFLLQAIVNYFHAEFSLSPTLLVTGSLVLLVLFPLWRTVYTRYVIGALGIQRVLFIGNSPIVQQLARQIAEKTEYGFVAVGHLCEPDHEPAQGLEKCGEIAEVRSVVERLKPDRVVVAMAERRQRLPVYDLLDLRLSGLLIEEASAMYETTFGRVPTRELRPSQLIFSAELGPRRGSVTVQTLYSIAFAVVGIIVSAPVMIVVALLVKLTSKGPALYRQTRVGLNGRTFTVLKFRSMRVDAEAGTGAVWATAGDPRVTPIGKWLRKLRLDELPQFFNVLRGDMSIVGPRPERPEFVKTLSEQIPFYRQRHCVKPGITGWAQINHKYGDTYEDTVIKLEYDLYYIKHLAPSLDAYIIFHTLKVMLLSRGAQ